MKRAVVGMSGGVDSSVAAHLLKKSGYSVHGVSFILYESRMRQHFGSAPCCSIASVNDAADTARALGVEHRTIDLRDEFMAQVIEPFVAAYSKGLTPNPCILCNMRIKFPYLLKAAKELGADVISTGHYAQVEHSSTKLTIADIEVSAGSALKKGIDEKKDQSYVLYGMQQEELLCLNLPLGSMKKSDVRKLADDLGLPAARRPESQEICFVEGRNYLSLVEAAAEDTEGPMIQILTGKELGRHKGIHRYTIGQRKRLGIESLEPMFVARIDPKDNAVYVGPRETAMMREFSVSSINWLVEIPSGLHERRGSFRAFVKVRSTMKEQPATITVQASDSAKVVFDEPQWAPAPGQSAVFYVGDIVAGGGFIDQMRF
ncbi:MAG: tRNA 2-thiouridine(34) synthase MnmA [Nitrospiraceae bacterium]|nr:tRNA 2-thiouridine(34) synthase MnmA [Nitrospiraceae bacterium]